MLIGLTVFATRSGVTLGDIGAQPTRHPDPTMQRSQENRIKLMLGIGLGILAFVIVLAATGIVRLDPQVIGQYMTYLLVGLAVVYFSFLFIAGGLKGDEQKRVLLIVVLFIFAAVFWSAFEQAPTSLNLFARDFTNRNFGRFEVPATWFQSINSAFIILLAPFFAALWTRLGAKKRDLSSPGKFSLGLLFAGIGFFIMIFAANMVAGSGGVAKVYAMWLVGSYFFQTIGELCLSPVGLSSMTKLSPRRYVGQMMGIWFLAAAVGNLISGLVGGHVDPKKINQMPQLFTVTTASLMIAAIVLGLLTIPIRRMMQNIEQR
jgi:POT family proton-dependent oligopeptide transporter